MEKKSFFENLNELRENLTLYVEKRLSLIAVMGLEKAAKVASTVIALVIMILFLVIFWLFASAAAAIYIGRLLESIELGLLIVAFFYLFLGIIFFVFRKQIFGGIIISKLVNVFFKHDDDDENKSTR
jgi:hypothetical protein